LHRAAFLSLVLGLLVATDALVPASYAQVADGEVVVAQNDRQNIFRFFFGNRRRDTRPQFFELPRVIIPQIERREAPRARRERRNRPAAPVAREVAAVEKAANAKRVLVVGDFMAGALAKGLAEAYRENPNVVVVDASNGSSGLVRKDYYDWPAELPKLATEQKPDAILALIGANDRQGMDTETGSVALGSDRWRTAYAGRVAALADALKGTGKPVLWAGLVPVASGPMSRDYSAFNSIVREQLEPKGVRYVETWNGFADEGGKYVAVGPDVGGQSVQLRASDGLNFTKSGQRKLAFFVEQELNAILGGTAPQVASLGPGVAPGETGDPRIGPMVPFEALGTVGGDALSPAAGAKERGIVAASISKRIADEKAAEPPIGRADNYFWPPPPLPVAATPEPINDPRTPATH
jgi:uncharacterized protein